MKLIIEIDLDKENWEPTTAQVRTVLRRTANRLEQKLPCVGLEQPIVNDEEIVIGKWGIFEKERIMQDGLKVNHGFWDLPPEERAAIKDAACRRNDCVDFYDLPPEERDRAYSKADED